ncbi:helix-turn-helix domain-containing protein [Massilia agri]|uniref:XRE family transcriptional regulator n=1 Tax=Massilia agri TaxID=1886785 RepID=A0ABT2AFY3_9BURK|nr:XRE family transcriptional regulator [Massilia agri]MCS0595096.1 XRE family transcriptional regulator [Massilia agri]
MDINQLIASRLRELREAQGLTLAALAGRSGVSRSNISSIERGESSATATVLDRLSAALGVTLASLFDKPTDAPSPVARRDAQPVWTDPVSGYVRRNLSPLTWSPIQMVEVSFPAGQRIAYETAARNTDVYQQIWIIEGELELTLGDTPWQLGPGDCLAMKLDQPVSFHNPGDRPVRYLVALVTQPHKASRKEDA